MRTWIKPFLIVWAATPILISCTSAPVNEASVSRSESACDWAMIYFSESPQLAMVLAERDLAQDKVRAWEGRIPDPANAEEYLKYLTALDQSGRSMEAGVKIKGFLSKYPKEKRGLFLLAVHYYRLKKKEMAKHLFLELEKDTEFAWKAPVYNNLAMLALEDKNRNVAIDYLEKAVTDSKSPAPYVNLGTLYLQGQSFARAEKLFRKALDLDPEFEEAVLGLGGALEGMGKYEDAHKSYAEFLSDNPEALAILYNDAIVLGNRLKLKEQAATLMLRYVQKGGRETAKAQEFIQTWR